LRPRLLIAALPLALALAGCGGTGINADADPSGGKEVFSEHCGSCHALADAGTQATVGPDLDAAFSRALEDGMPESTIREVTRAQIEYALPPMPDRKELGITDEEADGVAAYVASVAGREPTGATGGAGATPPPPAPPPPPPAAGGGEAEQGKSVFAKAGCVSCHTLADAGSSGTIGPNLDEAKPSFELAVQRVTNGSGAMPPFKGQLTDAEIQAVARYVSTVAGQ
jgi:mono/diheme cytochrome c family protein